MYIGLLVCLLTGVAATWLGDLQHFVSAPIIGLVFGVVAGNFLKTDAEFKKGPAFASKYLLKTGIVIAGATMNFMEVVGVGAQALPFIVFNIVLSFIVVFFAGKRLMASDNTKTLIGGGVAICGGTAIATLASVIKAKGDEIAYAMASIFLFDLLAALVIPYAASAIALAPEKYALLGGLAICDTSSVVAAGASYNSLMGSAATAVTSGISGGDLSVIVKLCRTTMLVPLTLIVMAVHISKPGTEADKSFSWSKIGKAFPIFILGFILLAVANTVGLVPASLMPWLKQIYKFFITLALVGIGFKIKLADAFKKGAKPILLGGITWASITASTVLLITFFG